jgi:hypothetical protein
MGRLCAETLDSVCVLVYTGTQTSETDKRRGKQMFIIRIASLNQYNEVEWEERIESPYSMRDAKSKATRYINRELCESDYRNVDKQQVTPRRATWWIE